MPLRYYRTLLVACKCGSLGCAMNWLNLCIVNVIPGLVIVRYNNLPTDLLYELGSFNSFPSYLLSLRFWSIGILASLQPIILASLNTSSVYFLWHKLMPSAVLTTSRPKKNFRSPKSFNLNCWSSKTFNSSTACLLLLAIKMSSTYTNRTIKEVEFFLVNKE